MAWALATHQRTLLSTEPLLEGIAHVVSRAHHPETLGQCERLWGTVAEDARRRTALWIAHDNFFQPHQGIDGLVTAERSERGNC